MPPNHQQYVQWNGERFRKWAAKIGQNTVTVVKTILTGYKVEQQGYRACMALLNKLNKYCNIEEKKACLLPTMPPLELAAICECKVDKSSLYESAIKTRNHYGLFSACLCYPPWRAPVRLRRLP